MVRRIALLAPTEAGGATGRQRRLVVEEDINGVTIVNKARFLKMSKLL